MSNRQQKNPLKKGGIEFTLAGIEFTFKGIEFTPIEFIYSCTIYLLFYKLNLLLPSHLKC